MAAPIPILEMKKIQKVFPGVVALKDVDFRMFEGEVHAVMGQNGAGKSTLVKVLTGVYTQDAGEILLQGEPIHPDSPLEAQKLGINTVYQEVNLCLNLTVAENIFIGKEPMKLGRIDWKEMNRNAAEVLSRLNINIDVTQLLSSCSIALQQMVAIARVIDSSAKILILDEPTSSLDESETEQLFKVIRKLRNEGIAILFITHFLDQTYQIADRITVLKDGLLIGEYTTDQLPKLELIKKMLGKELSAFSFSEKGEIRKTGKVKAENVIRDGSGALLKVNGLGLKGIISPFSMELNKGDVLGLAGLLGSGRSEAVSLIFGIHSADRGTIFVRGKRCRIHSPRNAMMDGIGFCSEDRKNEGIFADLSVRENIIQALQAKQGIFRFISMKQQIKIANKLISSLQIKTPGVNSPVGQLSGGNQQKVLLARWLATNPSILILDEPTRGIDVGAKLEIMEQILDLSKEGIGIIFISSEFEEIIRCSNKVVVLKDKKVIGELRDEEMTEDHIMSTIAGSK